MSLCQDLARRWPASEQDTAQAVCMAESGGRADAVGDGGDSIGLWQINLPAHPGLAGADLKDPATNAAAARAIWDGSGWGAWSTYNNGSFRQYLTGQTPASDLAIGATPGTPINVYAPIVGGLLALLGLAAAGIVLEDLI